MTPFVVIASVLCVYFIPLQSLVLFKALAHQSLSSELEIPKSTSERVVENDNDSSLLLTALNNYHNECDEGRCEYFEEDYELDENYHKNNDRNDDQNDERGYQNDYERTDIGRNSSDGFLTFSFRVQPQSQPQPHSLPPPPPPQPIAYRVQNHEDLPPHLQNRHDLPHPPTAGAFIHKPQPPPISAQFLLGPSGGSQSRQGHLSHSYRVFGMVDLEEEEGFNGDVFFEGIGGENETDNVVERKEKSRERRKRRDRKWWKKVMKGEDNRGTNRDDINPDTVSILTPSARESMSTLESENGNFDQHNYNNNGNNIDHFDDINTHNFHTNNFDGNTNNHNVNTFNNNRGGELNVPATEILRVMMPLKPILRRDLGQFAIAMRPIKRQI